MLAPFQPGYVPIAVSTFVFFAAYHFYSSPYQSLLPDLTPPGCHGRVQGYQSVMRGAGMFGGLVIAGFLFGVWKPLPFLICGVFIMVVTYITVLKIHEPEPVRSEHRERESVWGEVKRIWKLTVQDKPIRRFMVAAFLWEATLAGLRPFIILYFTVSLKASTYISSLLLVLVAVVYMVAGLLGGYLADKFGRSLIMRIGLWLYLAGSVLALLIGSIKWAFFLLPVFCLGGAIVVTLPYAILMGIMPREHVGGFTAMFSMVRGLANVIAPLLAGGAIDVTKHYLAGTQYAGREYAAIWGVCGLLIILSLFIFRGGEKDDVVSV
jgi:MFS family permease